MTSTPARALIVVYALDIEKVARFYSQVLERPVAEREERFVIVGDESLEIAVVRMSETVAKSISIADPPRIRSETALKPSFVVRDLESAIKAATDAGGGTKPAGSAWLWRGQLHLDGHDPEGNPVQFRVPKL